MCQAGMMVKAEGEQPSRNKDKNLMAVFARFSNPKSNKNLREGPRRYGVRTPQTIFVVFKDGGEQPQGKKAASKAMTWTDFPVFQGFEDNNTPGRSIVIKVFEPAQQHPTPDGRILKTFGRGKIVKRFKGQPKKELFCPCTVNLRQFGDRTIMIPCDIT